MELSNYVKRLSLRLPEKEIRIFSRLIYRNKNQHRRDWSFQKLVKVEKDFKKYYCRHDLRGRLQKFVSVLPDDHRNDMECNGLVNELQQCALFVCQLLDHIERTFIAVLQQVDLRLFLPFNLVMAASLSRLWFYLRVHLWAVDDLYKVLHTAAHIGTKSQSLKCVLDNCFHKFLPSANQSQNSNNLPTVQQEDSDDCFDTKKFLERRKQDFAIAKQSNLMSTDSQVVTNAKNRRGKARQPNSFIVVCRSRRQGRSCWKMLIRSKKLVQHLKALKHERGIGFHRLVATNLRVRYAAGIKLNFFGHCPRVTLCWRRQSQQRRKGKSLLHHLYQPKKSVHHDLDLQPAYRTKTLLDIRSIQASFLHQLENAAAATTANLETSQDHSVRRGSHEPSTKSSRSTTDTISNSHRTYSETDIDNLFNAINL